MYAGMAVRCSAVCKSFLDVSSWRYSTTQEVDVVSLICVDNNGEFPLNYEFDI